jgi:peptide/nickel transport system substrate-binding protein
VRAETPELKKKAADAVQVRAMEVVTHVPLGEWYGVWAVRSNVEVPAKQAPVEVFWGMNKK